MTGDRRFHLPRVRSEKFKRDEKMPEFIKADMLAELERQGQLKNSPHIPLQQHETTQLHINHWGSRVVMELRVVYSQDLFFEQTMASRGPEASLKCSRYIITRRPSGFYCPEKPTTSI
jgi:hypothetical protein